MSAPVVIDPVALPREVSVLTQDGASVIRYIGERQDAKMLAGFARAVADSEALPTSDFADKYISLPPGNVEPGPYRTARTPYLREVQNAFGDLSIPLVTHIKPAQVGATQALVNAVCRVIHSAPTTILFITEIADKARDLVTERFEPAFLRAPFHFPDTRARDNRDTLMARTFAGGAIRFFGGNASTAYSSRPAQLVILDEYARFPGDVSGEGSPLALALGRGRTYGEQAAIRVNSTPLTKDDGEGSLYTSFLLGDQREWFWPCPHCGEMQFYKMDNFRYDRVRAWFECAGCGEEIGEEHRGDLLERGEWRPTKTPEMNGARSYHTTGFMAPVGWISWRQIAERHKLAIAGRIDYQAFANLELGLFYEPVLTLPEVEEVLANCGGYKMADEVAPDGALILTAGADCQEEFIKCATYAWGREMKCWLLDWKIIPNPITSAAGQKELAEYFARTRRARAGGLLPITLAGIDSGGATGTTEAVYSFAATFPQPKITPKGIRFMPTPPKPYIIATKGGRQLSPEKLFVRASQIRRDKARTGQRLFIMGTPIAKAELYKIIRRPKQKKYDDDDRQWGGITLPADVGEQYAKEMVAEIPRIDRNRTTGEKTVRWHLPSGRANEGLDLHIINRFCASVMGLEIAKDAFWRALDARAAATKEQREEEKEVRARRGKKRAPASDAFPPSPSDEPPRPARRRKGRATI